MNKPLFLSQSAVMALRRVISRNLPAAPIQDCGELKHIYSILQGMTESETATENSTGDLFNNEK